MLSHDNAPALPPAAALAATYRRHGLRLVDARDATPDEIAAGHSSWAKRLRAGAQRPVTLLRVLSASRPEAAGEILTTERARSVCIRTGRLAVWQDRLTPLWSRLVAGCHPNRDVAATVSAAGFTFHRMESFDPFPRWVPTRPLLAATAAPSDRHCPGSSPGRRRPRLEP